MLKFSLGVFILLIYACKGEVYKDKVPTEYFFRNSEVSSFRISPDGKYISFLRTNQNGDKNLFIKNVADKKELQLTSFEGKSIRDYRWIGCRYFSLIVEDAACKDFGLYTLQSNGDDLDEVVFSNSVTKIDFIQKGNRSDNSSILFSMNDRDPERTDVYELSLETGEKRNIMSNPGNFIEWFADGDNVIRLARGSESTNENWYYRSGNKEGFKKIVSNYFTTNIKPIAFVKSQKHTIYALSNLGRDKYALVEFDCNNGKEIRTIYETKDADILDFLYSPKIDKVVYVSTGLGKGKIHFLSPNIEAYYARLNKRLGTDIIEIVDHDELEHNIILRAYSDIEPGSFYLYSSKKDSLRKLSDINSKIDSSQMSVMKPVSYKNREGVNIHAYLTLPKNTNRKSCPLIVMPHGGPYQRTHWGYDAEVQFFANRGYAVFQPNFRGSTGYGKAFFNAGLRKWNENIQNDVEDGVNWLIENNMIDSARIVAYGRGFGGLTAINLAIEQPHIYKCVISYSGILNLFTYIKSTPLYYKPHRYVIEELLGNPEKDIDYIKSVSPIFNLKKLNRPVFFFQGGKDARANMVETNQFLRELKKYNKEVEYVLREDEGYKIGKFENKVHFYNAVDNFLKSHLK
ncbi:alpha/beta hydrolase family protein [Pseudopedobacter saltans]|uniref:alpha/beta hydrolase family protein n=1 Tax=Pseudopedobacter saltans TaxID=151895 RepID=UPI00059FF30C|nr:prolyl oligopeptidase family serine peptidase [Pseudopedobacter saltans]